MNRQLSSIDDRLLRYGLCFLIVSLVMFAAQENDLSHQSKSSFNQKMSTSELSVTQVVGNMSGLQEGYIGVQIDEFKNQKELAKQFHVPNSQAIITAKLSITNKTSSEQPFIPATQIYLRDSAGTVYKPLPGIISPQSELPSIDKLAPGVSVSGELGFLTDNTFFPLRLYIDPDWAGYGPVVFRFENL